MKLVVASCLLLVGCSRTATEGTFETQIRQVVVETNKMQNLIEMHTPEQELDVQLAIVRSQVAGLQPHGPEEVKRVEAARQIILGLSIYASLTRQVAMLDNTGADYREKIEAEFADCQKRLSVVKGNLEGN